jgi:hypothetical protein
MEIGMFELILRVILSWQVIVITAVLIIYFRLVSYVLRPGQPGTPKEKAEKAAKVKVTEEELSGTASDDLGLEEESSPS